MVVFFDIDGTVIDNETQVIPESAIRAIGRLKANGHIPVVNTGRPYGHVDPRLWDMPFSGWICSCGLELRMEGKWLKKHTPDPKLCRFVFDMVRSCGMQATMEHSEGLLLDGEYSVHPSITREVGMMHTKGVWVRDISEMEEPVFDKAVIYDWPGCDRQRFLAAMEPYYTCILRENTMIEMVPLGNSKALGMVEFLNLLNLPQEDTMAIGDSTNDLPMFQVAKHTVCMGGGMEELASQAEYVTASVMDDGIEKALEHFGLI